MFAIPVIILPAIWIMKSERIMDFSQGYLKYGFNREENKIVYQDWAPLQKRHSLLGISMLGMDWVTKWKRISLGFGQSTYQTKMENLLSHMVQSQRIMASKNNYHSWEAMDHKITACK